MQLILDVLSVFRMDDFHGCLSSLRLLNSPQKQPHSFTPPLMYLSIRRDHSVV